MLVEMLVMKIHGFHFVTKKYNIVSFYFVIVAVCRLSFVVITASTSLYSIDILSM